MNQPTQWPPQQQTVVVNMSGEGIGCFGGCLGLLGVLVLGWLAVLALNDITLWIARNATAAIVLAVIFTLGCAFGGWVYWRRRQR